MSFKLLWSKILITMRYAASSLLELIYPEACVFCGAESGETSWSSTGSFVAGLSWSDGPHLCDRCWARLVSKPVRGQLPDSGTPVIGARATGPDLVTVIKHWKYHGVRGLAWPLAELLRPALEEATRYHGAVDIIVPIPLHKHRLRARGFNQAQMLAELAGNTETQVRLNLLRRKRSTGQQAKLSLERERRRNMLGAYLAQGPSDQEVGRRIGLVDDLVTGGMTCEAAVSALQGAGWQVAWVVCLGLANTKLGNKEGQVDSSAAEI
ncbi:MAG: putative amidophosphoribosyltransferase [Candidatus Krumholzibacteriia bacterium]|jgi:predicted amidophosphoribosyltransferase